MASALPPVKGAAFSFETALVAQADTDIFKAGPTLAAGDVKVIKDGTYDDNIDTLPAAVSSCTNVITVALSATEMDADRVTVVLHDAAGDEWQDQVITIYTAAQTFNATDVIADDIKAIVGHADYGNAKLVRSATPANALVVDAAGLADANAVKVGPTGAGTAQTAGDLATLIADVPTVAEFEARTLVAADYVIVGDTIAGVTTVGSVTGAVGSVTGAVGSVTGAVGSVAANGITATSIAADAINAAAVKADAVTKIQNGLATPTNITAGTIATVTNLTNLPAAAATAAELAKVPKSDSNVSWNATALAAINAEVDTALNTAIPGAPTADSINERIVAIDAYGAPPAAATIVTALEANGSKLDHLWEMTEDDGGVRRLTANALEESPASSGTGLTAQETRDAMKLAPSAGAAAAGSVDTHLDVIQAKTDTIGALTVTLTAPVATAGNAITVIRGDDYLLADGRELSFTGTNWPVITGGAVALIVRFGTVTSYTGVVTGAAACYVELTDTQTALLTPGVYDYDLQATLAGVGGSVITLAQGSFTVSADVR